MSDYSPLAKIKAALKTKQKLRSGDRFISEGMYIARTHNCPPPGTEGVIEGMAGLNNKGEVLYQVKTKYGSSSLHEDYIKKI